MRRPSLELLLFPLLVVLVIGAYLTAFAEKQRAYEAVVVKATELAHSAPRYLLDFAALEMAAHRAVLNDPTLRKEHLRLRRDIALSRIEMFNAGELAKTTDEVVRESLDRVTTAFAPIIALKADALCDDACLGKAVLLASPRIKRELSLLQTHGLKKDAEMRAAMNSAIYGAVDKLSKLSAIVICAGFLFAAYMLVRYRAALRNASELTLSHKKVVEVSNFRANFLAGMSHEFRTPLNAIKGFSEIALMLGESLPREKMLGYFKDIHGAAADLENITEAVLDMSRIDAGVIELDPQTYTLNDLIEGTLTQNFAGEQSSGRFMIDVPAELTICCDMQSLNRCINNLVSNSIKYSALDTPIGIGACSLGDRIEIWVSDEGRGIPEDELDRVWELYSRSSYVRSDEIQGTGLGLAQVRALAGANGGSARVESVVDAGTTVTLTFPSRSVDTMGFLRRKTA